MKTGFQWVVSPVVAFKNLVDRYIHSVQVSSYQTLLNRKDDMVQWMRSSATWQDRTGNARANLAVDVQQTVNDLTVIFEHGVFYGKYLEYDFAGRYAILQPAINFWMPILMQEIQQKMKAEINV